MLSPRPGLLSLNSTSHVTANTITYMLKKQKQSNLDSFTFFCVCVFNTLDYGLFFVLFFNFKINPGLGILKFKFLRMKKIYRMLVRSKKVEKCAVWC